MNNTSKVTRRDVLKAALLAGGAMTLSPLLKACAGLSTRAATTSPTPSPLAGSTEDELLGGLRGLDIDAFFQEAYRRWMRRDPENLTTLGLSDPWGVGDSELTDISDSYVRETQSLESETLQLLRLYDRSALADAQALTADVYDWFLVDLVRGHAFMYDDYPISPVITSVHYNLYMLLTVYQPLSNSQDAGDYISRLSGVGTKMDQLVDALRLREEHGVILPKFLFGDVLSDIDRLAGGDPPAHDYVTSFRERLTGVSEEERITLVDEVVSAVRRTVIPAYARLSGFLTAQQGRASNTVGAWQFPDGEAYYAQCLRRHTTTEMTAGQIHELGLQNVERVHAEMKPLFAALGYPADASIPQLIQRLVQDSGVYRGQEAVKAYEAAIQIAEALLPQAFSRQPRAQVKVIGGRDGDYYMPASMDGSRPGLFFARTNGSTPRFGIKTTGFHETIPGHHYQIALAQEAPGLPDLRRGMQFNAYTEGWALYAERLMSELGAYADDPQGDLGRLQMEAYRAARLVVETGIHAKHWSFSQAVDYLVQATGFPEVNAQSEITRYSVWPGQAASYYIGFLKLLDLRQKARNTLGSKFDLKAFHDVVLAGGSLPLTVLERLVDRYIQAAA